MTEFIDNPHTGLTWIDTLIEELGNFQSIRLAVALPINNKEFQQSQKDGLQLYGLPDPEEKSFFIKGFNKLIHATESVKINSHITRVVDDFDPDIIQIFGTENPFGLIIPALSKPVVMHIQGYLLVGERKWFTGISMFEQFNYTSIKDLVFMRGSFNNYFAFRKRAKLEEKVIRSCNYFMGRTDFDRRIISLLSPQSTYYHCEEFIRKSFFKKLWDFPLKKEIICVSILKGTTYKGIDLLVEASIVLKKYTEFSYRFKICGVSEDEEIVKIIKRKYKKETDFESIEFLGRLIDENLVNQLCDSNFYVHPSYLENSPNSICEAMALGMPIVATKVGGVDSILADKVEGLLVQEGDPYSFAAAIVELTVNYEFAKQLGRKARERAIDRHKPGKIADNLLEIYEKIMSSDGA